MPVRIEIGPRDIEQDVCVMSDRLNSEKRTISSGIVAQEVATLLDTIHTRMFDAAQKRLKEMWYTGRKLAEFGLLLENQPGFYQTGWCQDRACELQLKPYKATTRCLLEEKIADICFNCDKPSIQDVLVARSY